jgi:hypothetical protein
VKVAILGPSEISLSMAKQLIDLGASVRLFWRPELNTPYELELYESQVLIPAPAKTVSKRFLFSRPNTRKEISFC